MSANSARTMSLYLGTSGFRAGDYRVMPERCIVLVVLVLSTPPVNVARSPPSSLVTSIPRPPPFFQPLGVSILSRASLAQSFLISECIYDSFSPSDCSVDSRLPTPRNYCFATLTYFSGLCPYYLIIVLPTCTIRIGLLTYVLVTSRTFQTPRAFKKFFID